MTCTSKPFNTRRAAGPYPSPVFGSNSGNMAQSSAKASQSEARIGEIRAGAVAAVTEVATDTAHELVAALGGKADAQGVSAAVSARLKG